MKAYPLETKTTEAILEEKEYADYHNAMVEKQKGTANHLFLGHGND
jgi:hypothetical protein